ncbi:hypothetical protein F511_16706 [Dorcoceras hygrometricum]|uniref:Uncharacterized protein n=1 Tax=Dorcoceras hygrometricum TaxID=472368 RepID=A0A2Z7DAH7_9LAMI|nr:hypothetical protein F511_16706 [Dorcoceras hygrometricum]
MAHRRDNQQATMRATSNVQPSPRITCTPQRPISIATRRPAPPEHQRNDCAGQGQVWPTGMHRRAMRGLHLCAIKRAHCSAALASLA